MDEVESAGFFGIPLSQNVSIWRSQSEVNEFIGNEILDIETSEQRIQNDEDGMLTGLTMVDNREIAKSGSIPIWEFP